MHNGIQNDPEKRRTENSIPSSQTGQVEKGSLPGNICHPKNLIQRGYISVFLFEKAICVVFFTDPMFHQANYVENVPRRNPFALVETGKLC